MALYPSVEVCNRLQDEYCMPDNIRKHTKQVTRIAVFLGQQLSKNGLKVNVELLRSAAMLHDLLRPVQFKSYYSEPTSDQIACWNQMKNDFPGMHHAEAGYVFFKDDYPEMANIIRKHFYKSVVTDLAPVTWEEKILNYADNRVAHDKIVTMDERFAEGNNRWLKEHGSPEGDTKEINSRHKKIEKDIFKNIGLDPDKLEEYLDE